MRWWLPFSLFACSGEGPAPPVDRGEAPAWEAPAPVLRRLTISQFHNTVRDLFGDGIVLPNLEPDVPIDGLVALGAAQTTISPYGAEQYETAARRIAQAALASVDWRAQHVPCAPVGPRDDGCARQVLASIGRRAWRRPLEPGELDALVDLAGLAGETLTDFDEGLEYPLMALLQSPHFLYRVELGDGAGRYTDHELATRLSYFLWDTTPDAELDAAADAGELTTEAGLALQVDRMLADPRAVVGVRAFFSDLYHMSELDRVSKDPTVFNAYSPDLRASAREETLLGLEHLIFTRDASYRDLFDTRITFVDRRLAALYGVRAPALDGFAGVELPVELGRVGLLGQASFLLRESHPVSTSVTKRGIFVREAFLCQTIPPPPADVDTSIPEPSPDAPTMRERVAVHLEVDQCAACHRLTDPIGLGLENFDGIGAWRTHENGVEIDTSGALDGQSFRTAVGLGAALAAHPNIGTCLTDRLVSAATGVAPERGDTLVPWHADGFDAEGERVLWLLRDLVLGPGFRTVGDVR